MGKLNNHLNNPFAKLTCPTCSQATPDLCVGYDTCDTCRSNPSCGWCDDGSLSGLGVCHLGGAAGPLKRRPLSHANFDYVDDEGSCVEGEGRSWHFTSCPGKWDEEQGKLVLTLEDIIQLYRMCCQQCARAS